MWVWSRSVARFQRFTEPLLWQAKVDKRQFFWGTGDDGMNTFRIFKVMFQPKKKNVYLNTSFFKWPAVPVFKPKKYMPLKFLRVKGPIGGSFHKPWNKDSELVVSKIFYFHPENLGSWTHLDEHMFQMGWFNHQLGFLWTLTSIPWKVSSRVFFVVFFAGSVGACFWNKKDKKEKCFKIHGVDWMECCQCDFPWVQSDGDVVVFFGGGGG